jgi:uncharacterized protein
MMKKSAWLIPIFLVLLLPMHVTAAKTKFVTIGTGGVTGVYFPTGGAISKLVNAKRSEYGLKVTVEATGGSVFNINALMTGDMDFALAQSDRGYQAWEGLGDWKDRGRQKDLRGVFTLHSESVCLIAAEDSGIEKCSDLKGKRVAIGNPGSGTLQNSIDALALCGLTPDDLGKAEGIKAAEAAGLLQDDRLDAYFYTVGHPNGSIKEAAAGRIKVRFIGFPDLGDLLTRKPYYSKTLIPVKYYPGVQNKKDVPTFGVKASFLTSAKIPDRVVYAVTKIVFENLKTLRALHPALAGLKKKEMLQGLAMPIHPGALKYYKEAGLDKYIPAR